MSLRAQFEVPDRGVRVHLEMPAGSTTAIVGPNGSGKSTVLAVLAGLVRADGSARLGQRLLFDGDDVLAPHKRRIALLAQHPRLFPTMTARANVEFALRARRAALDATPWLDLVSATELADRKPHQLSGGQAQRVAIARALAAEPDLLLLDEPLAALDTAVAAEIRHTLARVLADRSAILVTHEIVDAALLADQMVVMAGGHVVEAGPTASVMRSPRTDFAARLCGLNLVRGVAVGPNALRTDLGVFTGVGTLSPGEPAVAAFAPSAVSVYRHPPHGSPRNVVAATVRTLTPHGQAVRIATDAFAADLTPAAVAELDLGVTSGIYLSVKTTEVRLYEP